MEKTRLFDDKIFLISNLVTPETCSELIDFAESCGFNQSSVSGGGHGRTGREDARTSQFLVVNNMDLAQQLWKSAQDFLPQDLTHLTRTAYLTNDAKDWTPVGINPRCRLYKYEKGQAFPEHIDYKMQRIIWRAGKRYTQRTYMTLLLYLNDNFTGGDTGFWTQHDTIGVKEHCRFLRGVENKPHQVVVQPVAGTALINDQNILHEGMPVKKGVKYVMRTDIIHQKPSPLHPKLVDTETPKLDKNGDYSGEWEKMFETSCKNYAD